MLIIDLCNGMKAIGRCALLLLPCVVLLLYCYFWQTIEIDIRQIVISFWKNFTQRHVSQIVFLFLICSFYLFSLKCSRVTSTINSFKLQWTFPNQPTTTSNINLIRCFIHKILALLSVTVNFVLCSWFHICLFCTSNKCQYTLCTVLFCKYSFSALRIPN